MTKQNRKKNYVNKFLKNNSLIKLAHVWNGQIMGYSKLVKRE